MPLRKSFVLKVPAFGAQRPMGTRLVIDVAESPLKQAKVYKNLGDVFVKLEMSVRMNSDEMVFTDLKNHGANKSCKSNGV